MTYDSPILYDQLDLFYDGPVVGSAALSDATTSVAVLSDAVIGSATMGDTSARATVSDGPA